MYCEMSILALLQVASKQETLRDLEAVCTGFTCDMYRCTLHTGVGAGCMVARRRQCSVLSLS